MDILRSVPNLLGAGLLCLIASVLGGNIGSMSSIRREWHREDIYSRCIRPNVPLVCMLPPLPSALLGLGVYIAVRVSDIAPGKWAWVAGCTASFVVAHLWSRARGRRIYGGSVRRAGF